MNAYKTLRSRAETEYIVQKSRFLCQASPAADAQEALAFLEVIKAQHRGANHNCYAYIIGQNKGIIRYSDDGEPFGTAGKPIVDVMLAKDVVDCVVVVTRYFGGILLGAGGLVRAYAHSATLALEAAEICEMVETARWHLDVAYPLWDRVEHALQALPVIAEQKDFMQSVTVSLILRTCDEDAAMAELMKLTDGRIGIQKEKDLFYHPWNA